MTFSPEQIMEADEWLAKHKGHVLKSFKEEFELDDGRAVKVMHYRRCLTCMHTHLFKMETVERRADGDDKVAPTG